MSKSLPDDKQNLKLSDFSILENVGSVHTAAGNFYSATFDSETNENIKDLEEDNNARSSLSKPSKLPVTLLLSSNDNSIGHAKNQFSLSASLNFQDSTNCKSVASDSDGMLLRIRLYKYNMKIYFFLQKTI